MDENAIDDLRRRVFQLIVLAVFTLLAARLYHIQFVLGSELRTRAEDNQFVEREIEADRGVIYDAEGRQVVLNRPRFTIRVVPAALPDEPTAYRQALRRLSEVLEVPLEDGVDRREPRPDHSSATGVDVEAALGTTERSTPGLRSILTGPDGRPLRTWDPVPVARGVTRATAFAAMEAATVDLPFLSVGEAPVREYPHGPTLAHLLGFAGHIPAEQLDDYRQSGYRIYDIVGRAGLEATYEAELRGRKGGKIVEVDAMGREHRTIGQTTDPAPGHSLHLTLDLDFQRAVEGALERGLRQIGARTGAAVVLDPRDGAVRALVSQPSYDNNIFSAGASREAFAALIENRNLPLVNRAISGSYPPGSTFKMVTAAGALEEGVITPRTRILDPGAIVLPHEYNPEDAGQVFVCWLRSGHGVLNVVGALAQSCDVFFYEVAGGYYEQGANQEGLGSARLAAYARQFGLGTPTGVELLGEADGLVPTKDWFEEATGQFWGTGQTYNMGIGQGNLLTTPIQMARVTAAVANGGTLHTPHLVDRITDHEGGVVRVVDGDPQPIDVAPAHLALVRQGMIDAVESGTARRAWSQLPAQISIGGKTGTAEFCDWSEALGDCRRNREGFLLTHAWFVAFAPADAPEVAVAVFVDGSGLPDVIEGSREAAPIAGDILHAYFGLPTPAPPPTACADCEPASDTTPAIEPATDGQADPEGSPDGAGATE